MSRTGIDFVLSFLSLSAPETLQILIFSISNTVKNRLA